MSPIRRFSSRTFHSLKVPNYRRYFIGQCISMSGTWMQVVGQGWLVLRLTRSGVALGVTTALQFLPVLIFGAWGGLIADRVDKRKALFVTQSAAGLLALALGVLTATGVVTLWMVYVLALMFGFVSVVDIPVRQSFVVEMVGEKDLTNAVGLNSATFTSARIIGPAIAGLLIATLGIAPCFLINAASYIAVILGLKRMQTDDLQRRPVVARAKGQLRAGFRYIWATPELKYTLLLMSIVGTLSFNFQVLTPLLAKFVFHGGAGTYGLMGSVMGVGSLIGALTVASRSGPSRKMLLASAATVGVFLAAAALSPSLVLELISLAILGWASIVFISTSNSTLQLNSSDAMRGRVMAIYSVVFVGSSPIGGPLVGWIAQHFGVRSGLWLGAAAAFVAVAIGLGIRHRGSMQTRPIVMAEFPPVSSGDAVAPEQLEEVAAG